MFVLRKGAHFAEDDVCIGSGKLWINTKMAAFSGCAAKGGLLGGTHRAYLLLMLLHVAQGVFVSIQKLEGHPFQADGGSDVQILGCEVLEGLALKQLLARFQNPPTLQKLSSQYT